MKPAIGDIPAQTSATSSGSSWSSALMALARSQEWSRASPTRIPKKLRARYFAHHGVRYRAAERASSREAGALLRCAPFPLDLQVRRRRYVLHDCIAGPYLAGQELASHGGADGHVLD